MFIPIDLVTFLDTSIPTTVIMIRFCKRDGKGVIMVELAVVDLVYFGQVIFSCLLIMVSFAWRCSQGGDQNNGFSW